jgi:hypothetical protein
MVAGPHILTPPPCMSLGAISMSRFFSLNSIYYSVSRMETGTRSMTESSLVQVMGRILRGRARAQVRTEKFDAGGQLYIIAMYNDIG